MNKIKCISLFFLVFVIILISGLTPVQGSIMMISSITFGQVTGFTLIDVTYYPGTFQGANIGDEIHLGNGMVFSSLSYHYTYAFQPSVLVWARAVETDDGKTLLLWRLLIEDRVYNVMRLF